MGLIEWITGWEYVGNTIKRNVEYDGKYYVDPNKLINRIHPKIIPMLNKAVSNSYNKKLGKWCKKNRGHAPLGRTLRGLKVFPNFTVVGYVNGKTYRYKGKETYFYIDNHGHGGTVSNGMDIWRKRR